MSTPPYAPPSVGSSGLQVSSYQSILNDNIQIFLNIYGTNQYVAEDSAIYQFICALSLKQSDTNLGLQLAYNQASPQTAVGAGLDRDVKMNGLAREPFTFSTALLTLTGTSGTVITNGFAQDQSGNLWAFPTTVTITGGSVNISATCTTPGAVAAEPGTINIRNTPTPGWTAVTNSAAANLGQPIESDSKLRARQAVSVALPSLTPLAATVAAILATPGVIRMAPGYPTPGGGPGSSIENPTGAVDSWGNPPHSISMVVDCTNTVTVAQAIYNKKTIGCFTNGTTTVPVVDATTGVTESISFFLPTNLPIFANIVLTGYGSTPNSAVLTAVQTAVVSYLNSLAIGETVSIGAIYYEIMAVNNSITAPNFGTTSVQIGLSSVSLGTADITMTNFYYAAQGIAANIVVTA